MLCANRLRETRFGNPPRRKLVHTHTHTYAITCIRTMQEEERLDNEFGMRHRLIEYGMSMKLDLRRG